MADDPQEFRQVPDTRLIWQDGIGPVLALHPGVPQEQRDLFVSLLNKGRLADRLAEVLRGFVAGADSSRNPEFGDFVRARAALGAYQETDDDQ